MDLFDKKFVYFAWDEELRGKECFYNDDIASLMQSANENRTDFKGCLEPSTSTSYPFRPVGQHRISLRFAYYDPNYECKIAYMKGEQIQHREKGKSIWLDGTPAWDEKFEYRIKPVTYYVGIDCMKSLTWDFDSATYKHVYASFDTLRQASTWISEHKKFVPVMRAFEKGLTIEYKRKGGDWTIASTPSWSLSLRYRVKPKVKEPCRACFSANKWEPKKRRMTNRELSKWLAEGKGQKMEGQNKFAYTTYAYKDGDDMPCREGVRIRAWNETQWHEPEVAKEVE